MYSKYIAVLVLALVAAGSATAGQRLVYQVFVSDASRYANGAIADARGSADAQQSIGCYYNQYSATCFATTSTGLSRSCSTGNTALIEIVRSIGPESYIYFQWNTDGSCNYILVENSSRFKPGAVSGT
jgi:hypothetical protein